MGNFKFKITRTSCHSYECTITANEKLDAFAKIKAYINETYANNTDLIDYELMDIDD